MLLVGLTGGIGSGKTTVARMLEERGAVVLDADEFARLALAPGTPEFDRVVEAFGSAVLASDGSLDRSALAGVVFGDEEARRTLEAIVHPEVMRRFLAAVGRYRETGRVVVYVVPLLVERRLEEMFDVVVTVSAEEDRRVSWASRSRRTSPDDIRVRARVQATDEDRERVADHVLRNDGTIADLERAVDRVWPELQRQAAASAADPEPSAAPRPPLG
jgi:dephospho-CoA kinase